uniref:Essential protein Yae1 N-terminal domain-containing protein n=1 Tax=Leptocylindrus danicus TaxID=163516 RepID=A0A7S2NYI5_9STRA|mmetsp:Transcript_17981/g.26764  ORF Transcript_17981/g.26764 Transcript_17981/m.26764 type:complete len:186 (+) Transcript_17981:39-596(+)
MSTSAAGTDDFLDSALDPYQHCADAGRRDGEAAGLARGFTEGRNLGMKKSWEFRFELGYYAGFVEFVATEQGMDAKKAGCKFEEHVTSSGSTKEERLERNINGILHAIEEFPTSDDLQRASNDEEDDDSHQLDLPIQIQRIRAKFKLLLIQLGLPPTFSLANILNKQENKNSETSEAGEHANFDF